MNQCDCSTDDFESPSCYRQLTRKARKEHECCECGEAIVVGQKYEETTGVWAGDPERYRTCLPCARIRDTYCAHGYIHMMLRETIQECLGFDYVTWPAGARNDEDEEENPCTPDKVLPKLAAIEEPSP